MPTSASTCSTITVCCLYFDFDPAYAQHMTQMQGLIDWWKEQAIERSEKLKEHWMASMKDQEDPS